MIIFPLIIILLLLAFSTNNAGHWEKYHPAVNRGWFPFLRGQAMQSGACDHIFKATKTKCWWKTALASGCKDGESASVHMTTKLPGRVGESRVKCQKSVRVQPLRVGERLSLSATSGWRHFTHETARWRDSSAVGRHIAGQSCNSRVCVHLASPTPVVSIRSL